MEENPYKAAAHNLFRQLLRLACVGCFALAILAVASLPVVAEETGKDLTKELTGAWKITIWSVGGEKAFRLSYDAYFLFTDDTLAMWGWGGRGSKYTVSSKGSNFELDLLRTNPKDPPSRQLGSLSGKKLKLCWSDDFTTRPLSVAPAKGVHYIEATKVSNDPAVELGP